MTDIIAVADQVRDAQTGYTIYGHNYARLSGKTRIFRLLTSKKWNTFLQLVTLVHCILRVWENDFSAPRKVADKLGEDETPLWPVIVSAFILAVYVCHSVIIIFFYRRNLVRWKEFENSGPMRAEFIYLVLSCLFLIDFMLLTIQYCLGLRMPQIFACFRSLLILTIRRKSRHVFKVITLVSFKMWKFWAALFGFILFFSAFSVHTFAKIYSCIISCDLEIFREENSNLLNLEEYRCFDDPTIDAQVNASLILCGDCSKENLKAEWCTGNIFTGSFDHIGRGFVSMFTAFTTENYPDIMFPAYDYSNERNSRWVTLFFAVYLYLGAFFFNALIIGVIIDAYWVVSKDEVKAERTQVRKSLALAWERLVGNDAEEENNKISVEDEKLLELFTILKPDNNKEENQNLISMLDTINDGYIDPFDWTTRLLDILRIQFKNDDEESVENLVKAKQFSSQRLLIFLVPLHTILFLSYYVQINCYVYLGIHSAQTLIIFLSFNAKALRKKLTRKIKFDMWLYIFALGCSVCWYITFFMDSCICTEYKKSCQSGVLPLSIGGILRATSALLMLLRLIYSVSWFEKGSSMISYLFNIVVDLFVVVMVLQFFFAQVGYESFVGTELDLSIIISGRDASGYNCGFGFDSFVCSILIQLQIFSTNDWPAIMENLALDYKPKFFVYTYFIGCFIIINLVCMQMVIAVILEAFKIFANRDSQKDLQKLQDEKRKSKSSFNLADMLTTFATQTASSNSSEELANKTRPDDSDVFYIGAKVLVERDYTDQLNDIYLDKGDEIEIVDITNNHVTAAMEGDIIGSVPKNILEGFKEPEAVVPNPRLSHRTVAIRPESWTVGVHGDMTVMNKDEMVKLNQVFKGSLVTGEERLHQRKKKRRKRTVSDEKPNWVESFSKDFNVQISVNDSVEESFEVIQEEPEPDESEITLERTATKVKFSEVIHEIPLPESREESPAIPLSRKELMRLKRRSDSIKKI